MTKLQYEMVLTFLHFNVNTQIHSMGDPSYDRLFKLRTPLSHMYESFCAIYTLGGEIVVYESLVPFHGRLCFQQCIPTKRARYWVKV